MFKSEYQPHEAQEQLKLIDESSRHDSYKDRARRYIQKRIVEVEEVESRG